jgi:prepilin-type N-terminal cleavage/methylation domain-containing protein
MSKPTKKGAFEMKKKKGFTLIELLVVIAIIAMLLAILMPALNKVKQIAQRVICGTNLKGLGTAQNVYANDYEDQFAKQGGNMNIQWGATTTDWFAKESGWQSGGDRNITVGASLYLLVREADVSPKSFVCPGGTEQAYEGQMPDNFGDVPPDLVEMWDFGGVGAGTGPRRCVSYSYQDPYGTKAASGTSTASFAVMADKNPFFDPKLEYHAMGEVTADNFIGFVSGLKAHWAVNTEKYQIQVANAQAHRREGQNILYGDGHSSFEKYSDVGVRNDNIYTIQTGGSLPEDIRRGLFEGTLYESEACWGAPGDKEPQSVEDSWLVNDDFGDLK